MKFLISFAVFVLAVAQNGPFRRFFDGDRIGNLPGLTFRTSFEQYSGYLNASIENRTHYHFYWLVESQSNPSTDPLVLWLNGGPGCSSFTGFFEELGPFRPHKEGGTLFENVYAWNKVANMVFMESPAGVGFSFAEDGNVTTDDDLVAEHNYAALADFFKKHPAYEGRDFYISGESYGGVYLPTLAQRIIHAEEFAGNFKGMLVGNGMLSYKAQYNSLVYLQYFRGVIGYDDFEYLNQACCGNATEVCNYYESLENQNGDLLSDGTPCGNQTYYIVNTMLDSVQNDAYNQYQDCYAAAGSKSEELAQTLRTRYPWFGPFGRRGRGRSPFDRRGQGYNPWWRFPPEFPQPQNDQTDEDVINYDSTDALSGFPCWMDNATMDYLNNPFNRLALHVRLGKAPDQWRTCNPIFETPVYHRMYTEMDEVFADLIANSSIRILVYNGDVDSVCNFLGDEWFVRRVVETNLLEEHGRRDKWMYRGRIAGYVQQFDRIDLLTVKGAGHFVPTDRAGPALQMFANFIGNTTYNTPVKSDSTSDSEPFVLMSVAQQSAKPMAEASKGQGSSSVAMVVVLSVLGVLVIAAVIGAVYVQKQRRKSGYAKL